MNENDREAADDWIRDHMPDPNECRDLSRLISESVEIRRFRQ